MNHDYEISDQVNDKIVRLATFVASRGSSHLAALFGHEGKIMTPKENRLFLTAAVLAADVCSDEFERIGRILLADSLTKSEMNVSIKELNRIRMFTIGALQALSNSSNIGNTFISRALGSFYKMFKIIADLSESYAAYKTSSGKALLALFGNALFKSDVDRMIADFNAFRPRLEKIDKNKVDEIAEMINRIEKRTSHVLQHSDKTDWRNVDLELGDLLPPTER